MLVRVGVTSESVAELVRTILMDKDLTDISLVSMRDRAYGYPTRQVDKKHANQDIVDKAILAMKRGTQAALEF